MRAVMVDFDSKLAGIAHAKWGLAMANDLRVDLPSVQAAAEQIEVAPRVCGQPTAQSMTASPLHKAVGLGPVDQLSQRRPASGKTNPPHATPN